MKLSHYVFAKRLVTYSLAILISIYSFFPIYWSFISAFRPLPKVMTAKPNLLPGPFTLESFFNLWTLTDFPIYYRNSIVVAICTMILSLVLSVFTAYTCVKFRFFGKNIFVKSVLFMYMFPPILIGIPLYIEFSIMKIRDTLIGLILADTAKTLPFAIWLLMGYFKTIPLELEEAALVDGASRTTVLLRIILPISAPGIVSVLIFAFMEAWVDYVFPLILISSEANKTATLGLADLIGAMEFRIGEMMAGCVLISIPVLIPLLFLTNLIIQGLTAGAVKR